LPIIVIDLSKPEAYFLIFKKRFLKSISLPNKKVYKSRLFSLNTHKSHFCDYLKYFIDSSFYQTS